MRVEEEVNMGNKSVHSGDEGNEASAGLHGIHFTLLADRGSEAKKLSRQSTTLPSTR